MAENWRMAMDTTGQHIIIEYGRIPDARAQFGLTRSKVYELIAAGQIKSASVRKKGARHGVRLIDMQSVRDFLRANLDERAV